MMGGRSGTYNAEKIACVLSPISLRRYLHFSTLLGVFSGALSIYVGSTVFFFYFVMLFNLLLIWAFLGSVVLPKWLGSFLLYLAAGGAIGVFRGTDTIYLVVKQLGAISLSALYFANFFELEGNTVDRAWLTYCRMAYWSSVLALSLWPMECLIEHELVRLHGIATEPAAFCLLALPAWYWFAHSWKTSGRYRKEVAVITIAMGCSISSLGYLGMAIGLLFLLTSKRNVLSIFAPIVILCLLAGVYYLSENVRIRASDTVTSLATNDLSGANLSTYAILSNMFVTERVLALHPFLGNGLGSHVLSNERYISEAPGVEELVNSTSWDAGANTHDAASLTLRSLSELGLVGFLGILWFIQHFRVGGFGYRAAISSGILLVFFEKMLRGGGYSNPEQFFFIFVYFLNSRQFRQERQGNSRRSALEQLRPGKPV